MIPEGYYEAPGTFEGIIHQAALKLPIGTYVNLALGEWPTLNIWHFEGKQVSVKGRTIYRDDGRPVCMWLREVEVLERAARERGEE